MTLKSYAPSPRQANEDGVSPADRIKVGRALPAEQHFSAVIGGRGPPYSIAVVTNREKSGGWTRRPVHVHCQSDG